MVLFGNVRQDCDFGKVFMCAGALILQNSLSPNTGVMQRYLIHKNVPSGCQSSIQEDASSPGCQMKSALVIQDATDTMF